MLAVKAKESEHKVSICMHMQVCMHVQKHVCYVATYICSYLCTYVVDGMPDRYATA